MAAQLPGAVVTSPYSVSHHASAAYLRLGQAQPAGQLLPLRPDHIVVLLEGPLQAQQLRGRERRPDAFGLPGERAVQEKVLRAVVIPWTQRHPPLFP